MEVFVAAGSDSVWSLVGLAPGIHPAGAEHPTEGSTGVDDF